MLQHSTVCFDRKQSRAKNGFCMIFCTRCRLMYERLWQTALADHCINKPLKNLRWSYGRLIWHQTALICTTELRDYLISFNLTSLKFKVARYPIIVSLDSWSQKSFEPAHQWRHGVWNEVTQSKTVFCTVRNGEDQGDTNSVDDFNRQLCVVCEVGVTKANVYLCAYMYGSTMASIH